VNLSAKQLEAAARELCRLRMPNNKSGNFDNEVVTIARLLIVEWLESEKQYLAAIEHAKREVPDGE
jgi:hypothetical protein